jgi:hypothetical protein
MSRTINPANACMNLIHTLCEAECRTALIATGLDPEIGLLHRDAPNRLPEEKFDFLGYTFGRCYSPKTGRAGLLGHHSFQETSAAFV